MFTLMTTLWIVVFSICFVAYIYEIYYYLKHFKKDKQHIFGIFVLIICAILSALILLSEIQFYRKNRSDGGGAAPPQISTTEPFIGPTQSFDMKEETTK